MQQNQDIDEPGKLFDEFRDDINIIKSPWGRPICAAEI